MDRADSYSVVVTGGVASGKSTLTHCFEDHGVPVIDADSVAREVVCRGSEGLAAVVARFGSTILDASGELDRARLRQRVFANPAERAALESIVHPRVRAALLARLNEIESAYVVLAIPLFVETDGYHWVNRVCVLDIPQPIQRQRLLQRDHISAELAQQMIDAQASRASRWSVANDIVINDGPASGLQQAAATLHVRYLALANQWRRPTACPNG